MSLTEAKAKIKDIPISTVIGRYLTLNKKGIHLAGLCPFHQDSHPSLMVNDQKGLFRCFACDTGGDSITFVQKYKSLGFKEAVLEICSLLGIACDDLFNSPTLDPKILMGRKLMEKAAFLYRQVVLSRQIPAFQDFLQKRGLDLSTAEKFQLGYAPTNNMLLHYFQSTPAKERHFVMEVAHELGLVRTGLADNQGREAVFDTFRDRIIFPIWDSWGNVVGFSSRAIHNFQKAKYLNSQESFIFNKKNNLYGFNFAKSKIRETNAVILVEGHMDLIALHKNGFNHSVAIMGVAISERSIKNLKSLTKNLIMALDSDPAGMTAMVRINRSLMKHALLPKYLDFHPYKDPDEFLSHHSPAELVKKIENAPVFLDKIISEMIPSPLPDNIDRKLQILEKIFEELAPLEDSLISSEKVVFAANLLKLQSDSSQIIQTYQRFLKEQEEKKEVLSSPTKGTLSSSLIPLKNPATTLKSLPPKKPNGTISRSEKILIQECLWHPEILIHDQLTEILEYLEQNEVHKLVQCLHSLYFEIDESQYNSIIMEYLLRENFSLEIREIVGSALFNNQSSSLDQKVVDKLVTDLKHTLAKRKHLKERDNLRKKQKYCENQGESLTIIEKITQVERQIHNIDFKN